MPASVSSSEIEAIISLLDDPDPVVQRSIHHRLVELGGSVAPMLRRLIADAGDESVKEGARRTLRRIGVDAFRREMESLLRQQTDEGEIDLEQGAFAPALLEYPELNLAEYSQQLDTMASTLEVRLRKLQPGIAVLHEINRYLIGDLGFRGCRQDDFYEPENSYMNLVLERRIGIPITLSIVYLLVASRIDLPLHGVGFPMHFLTKYSLASEEFYVDAFNGGVILSRTDCVRYLRDIGVEPEQRFLEAADSRQIVTRMMVNLVHIFRDREPELASELERAIAELAQ